MVKGYNYLLGEGPYPFSLESPGKLVNMYIGGSIIMVETNKTIDFLQPDYHGHSSYEFVIPYTPIISILENKKRVLEKMQIFPINSEQEHGPAKPTSGCKLLGIMIDKQLVKEVARSIFGIGEVVFENNNNKLDQETTFLINKYRQEAQNKQAGHQLIMESLSTQLVVNLLRKLKNNLLILEPKRNFEKGNIKRAIDYMMENYTIEYSLEDLASIANISRYHFIRQFKERTGQTPYQYLLSIKLEKACNLLKGSELSITEICYSCGFSNSSQFTTLFKQKVGISPSRYRKAFREK